MFERMFECAERNERSKRDYKALVGELAMRVRELEHHCTRMQRRESRHQSGIDRLQAGYSERVQELTVRARVMEREAREHYRRWRACLDQLDLGEVPPRPVTDEQEARLKAEVEEHFVAVREDIDREVRERRESHFNEQRYGFAPVMGYDGRPIEIEVKAGEGLETGGT